MPMPKQSIFYLVLQSSGYSKADRPPLDFVKVKPTCLFKQYSRSLPAKSLIYFVNNVGLRLTSSEGIACNPSIFRRSFTSFRSSASNGDLPPSFSRLVLLIWFHIVLCVRVKAFALTQNIADIFVVLFKLSLLPRSLRITVK